MSDKASERYQMTPNDLVRALEEFVRACGSARDVELRWLAKWIETQVLPYACQIRNGKPGEDVKALIVAMRLSEIGDHRRRLEVEIKNLDSEAGMLEGHV